MINTFIKGYQKKQKQKECNHHYERTAIYGGGSPYTPAHMDLFCPKCEKVITKIKGVKGQSILKRQEIRRQYRGEERCLSCTKTEARLRHFHYDALSKYS